jgi:hypothetical protein
MMGKTLINTI